MGGVFLQVESFSLSVDGGVIRGEVMYPQGSRELSFLIICHGIPQHRQLPDDRNEGYRALARYFASRHFCTVIFNFRGTGYSTGSFDLWGWRRDLQAVLKSVQSRRTSPDQEIAILGFSGGAATACITAAGYSGRPDRVILAACPADFDFLFDKMPAGQIVEEAVSIGIMKEEDIPRDPQRWIEKQKEFRPLDYVKRISPRPLLLIHGLKDDLVLPDHARRLYAEAGDPKNLVLLPHAPHQLRTMPRVWEICLGWLRSPSPGA